MVLSSSTTPPILRALIMSSSGFMKSTGTFIKGSSVSRNLIYLLTCSRQSHFTKIRLREREQTSSRKQVWSHIETRRFFWPSKGKPLPYTIPLRDILFLTISPINECLKEFADSLGIEFIETSAKNSTNVEKAFMMMASQIKARYKSQPTGAAGAGVNLQGTTVGGKSGGCC